LRRLIFLFPILTWFLLFILIPIGIVFTFSFLVKGEYGGVTWNFTFINYLRIFDPIYFKVLLNSMFLALGTTLMCLFLGVPMALWMARSSEQKKPILLFLVLVPFLSSFLVRTFAIKSLLSQQGLITRLIVFLGWGIKGDSYNSGLIAVSFGMITNYLPLMVLPLFVGFDKFNFQLIEAAKDLGANSLKTFWSVFLPNVKMNLISGAMMVFIPCLGEFVIPDLLGGAKVQTLGKVISEQFLKIRDWPFGATLGMVMIYSLALTFIEKKSKQ
jgi:spermidine/putrescine transport system permease protein